MRATTEERDLGPEQWQLPCNDLPAADYSMLEAVDPQPDQNLPSDGLEAQHLYGDETLNGKEVVKAEGLEVSKDDDNKVSTPTDLDVGAADKKG